MESAWNNIGILIVENENEIKVESLKYDNEVFCLKCYPSLYNGTFSNIVHRGKPNKSDMIDLSTLLDRPNIYSCDSKSFEGNDIRSKVET